MKNISTNQRDIAWDLRVEQASRKKFSYSCSSVFVRLFILANVKDDRSGESTDMADKVGMSPSLIAVSCDEDWQKT